MNAFAIAPGSPPTLYVGTFGQGVFRFPTSLPAADFAWPGIPVAGRPVGFTDLSTGRQVVIADAIAYLRSKGLTIPSASDQGGALFVTFNGLSSADVAFAGARTTAPSAGGRAGLAYPGVRLEDGFISLVYLFGLRENAADRSNLALVNMNDAAPVALRVTLYAGDGRSKVLPDLPLGPGQRTQIGHVLSSTGYASGWATVELSGGPGPAAASPRASFRRSRRSFRTP